ncbi:MAG: thermonuclease family protein [Pseudomonadota bacterium]
MFGWGRRRDGFEWREYVRTTILVRRKKRADRVAAAKDAAVDRVKDVGRRGAAASAAQAQAAKSGAVRAAGSLGSWSRQKFDALKRIQLRRLIPSMPRLGSMGDWHPRYWSLPTGKLPSVSLGAMRLPRFNLGPLRSGFSRLQSWAIDWRLILLIIGWGFIGAGLARVLFDGFDLWTIGLLAFGALGILTGAMAWRATLGALAEVKDRVGERLKSVQPQRMFPSFDVLKAAAGAVVAVLMGATAYTFALPSQTSVAALVPDAGFDRMTWPTAPTLPSLAWLNPFSPSQGPVKGRARVLSGDTLLVDGQTLKLSGIDAPERGQTCKRPRSQRWRCGVSAERALQKLVRRKTVSCVLDGSPELDRQGAVCSVGETDVAAELVKTGYVFAQPGFFAPYTGLESAAKEKKVGIWRGTPDRPETYRAARWAKALKRSPDGCPIKGRAHRSRGKIYVVPWSVSYDRYRVRTRRGDRWFCSEEEAIEAGWRPLERS